MNGCASVILKARGQMSEVLDTGGRVLVVFDGGCGLCGRTVRWLLRRDRWDRLRFVAAESPRAAGVVARSGMEWEPGRPPGSILAVRGADGPEEQIFRRSAAVRTVLTELPQPWPAVAAAMGWVPQSALDLGYRLVARWRHRIWGRSCPAPDAEERRKFL